jgi:hypothetical protein
MLDTLALLVVSMTANTYVLRMIMLDQIYHFSVDAIKANIEQATT